MGENHRTSHQVIGNLVQNFNITQSYVKKYDPWSGIFSETAFEIFSTTNSLKGYSPVQLVFGHDMILPIKHKVDSELIRQKKQTQINKDGICKNIKQVDHDYKAGDKVMLNNHVVYKFERPYKVPFFITQCCTNGTAPLQYVPKKKV